jgi:rhodanese-related sulfurtransferase
MKTILTLILFAITLSFPASGQNPVRNVNPRQADKLISQHRNIGDLVILDVRTPGEFEKVHISGAINIDWWSDGFAGSVMKLDTARVYLVYCTSGVRSKNASQKMSSMGFERVHNLKRGMIGWRSAKLPVEPAREEKN